MTIHLALGFSQKPLQYAGRAIAAEASGHSHSHEFSVEEVINLFWAGDIQHTHSHAEDSSHSNAHQHGFQTGSTVVVLIYSTFEFSYLDIENNWRGFHAIGPKDPFLSEILRPPIQA